MYTYPCKGDKILGGMVATFTGNRQVAVCKPSQRPIGFFIQDLIFDDPMLMYPENFKDNPVMIAVGQGEYKTDTFSKGTYKINDLLYCGEVGKVTNSPLFKGYPIVGIVNSVEKDKIGFISVFSNLEAVKSSD